ncbi:mannitol-1-phosphate 5-dehydrogenase [candidate division KSB3 bacterium]|uniref:Mannitol-1-phosphate 5-dehydrogenase n=1 Tax=candidate division KSB3 bacterium TaxID=2044937 RepID=A0A2G6E6U8_9BACT|nr:MAG: mannitol-1-phosphate 5-dehydrogenase [candidate division KSB3 bacterium]PIE30239.1 MAG: mannitol-1-phosphate 5-dehydrogenase [candidate division KSB3 bacterium]
MTDKKLVLFGAGNIGRSFIGQLFSRGGYEVVFVDINPTILDALNRDRQYRVVIKHNDQPDETILVEDVRAVNGQDVEQVSREIAEASIVATAVGKSVLPHILPALAEGLRKRFEHYGKLPLDIIMAENFRNVAQFVRAELHKHLPDDNDIDRLVGFVETSIGKMVPIMKEDDLAEDPSWVFAEAYNQLILDGRAFKNPIPNIPDIAPKDNMQAYVDRKLFIHNSGHAAAAYFGYQHNPDFEYLYEALAIPELRQQVRTCMQQSAAALNAAYPNDLSLPALLEHIDDLLFRFQNKALGDTIFRVGRDVTRKLDKDDRLVGAMLLAQQHQCACESIADAVLAACEFRAKDEHGQLFPADRRFAEEDVPRGLEHILTTVCRLSPEVSLEAAVMDLILSRAEGHVAFAAGS